MDQKTQTCRAGGAAHHTMAYNAIHGAARPMMLAAAFHVPPPLIDGQPDAASRHRRGTGRPGRGRSGPPALPAHAQCTAAARTTDATPAGSAAAAARGRAGGCLPAADHRRRRAHQARPAQALSGCCVLHSLATSCQRTLTVCTGPISFALQRTLCRAPGRRAVPRHECHRRLAGKNRCAPLWRLLARHFSAHRPQLPGLHPRWLRHQSGLRSRTSSQLTAVSSCHCAIRTSWPTSGPVRRLGSPLV